VADHVPDGRGTAARPPELPGGPPYFAGRRRELGELRADIDRPGLEALRGAPAATCRVLLVAGRPGSGRTSLAVRLARQVAARYPDGILFVRLTDPDGMPVPPSQAAARLLRELPWVPRDPAGTLPDAAAALRAAFEGRRAVLVLDDAVRAEQVLPLLPPGQHCLVVATSAGPLPGVPDVRPCTLGGLDSVAGVDLLSHVIGEIRVTVDPTAALTLSETCQGSPAALRLVGGWLAARPGKAVTDAIQALREPVDDDGEPAAEGTGDRRGAGPAARAFRLVHDTLPQLSARMLRLLALAPGGLVDPHIASALAGSTPEAARETLVDFAGYGLLRPEADGYRVPGWLAPLLRSRVAARERPAEVRLARARMLERTVRLLLACRAEAEPAESEARRRLAEAPRALRFPSAAQAARWLHGRLPELLAAAHAAVDDGELDTLARRFIAALLRALDAHGGGGPVPEAYELHGLLLEVAERRELPRDRAVALINLAGLDMAGGRLKDAVARYRAALDAARAGEDVHTAGRALEALGAAYQALGDPERAADWYGRALALRQTRGELAEVARLHGRLGELHCERGEFAEALREWRAVAAARRRLRDLAGVAAAVGESARVQQLAGHLDDALRTGHEALHWARQAADARVEGLALLRMADILDRLGDPAGARLQREAAAPLLGGARVTGAAGVRGGTAGRPARGAAEGTAERAAERRAEEGTEPKSARGASDDAQSDTQCQP
jgi:tetratricopeptide (TPR) repeat protein